MVGWKELGYVPDSEEEDDDWSTASLNRRKADRRSSPHTQEESQSKPTTIDTQDNSQTVARQSTNVDSTASRLERTLNQGLQVVRDILSLPSSPAASHQYQDQSKDEAEQDLRNVSDDSPLSSVPSSVAGSPRPSKLSTFPSQSPTRLFVDTSFVNQASPEFPSMVPQRSLRTRAPIQQHPYALENAHYRRLLESRGIKPVNVPWLARPPDNVAQNEDSQATESFLSSQQNASLDSQTYSHTTVIDAEEESQSPLVPSRRGLGGAVNLSDDDLPDLSELVRNHAGRQKTQDRAKNKSSTQTRHTQMSRTDLRIYDFLDDDENDSRSAHWLRERSFRAPPSPPGSGVLSITDEDIETLPLQQIAHGSTPAALPTPLFSSENQRSKRDLVVLSSSENSEDQAEDTTSSTSSESEAEESQGNLNIVRKIRGVPPASWVRLDRGKQPVKPKVASVLSPTIRSDYRGVARPAFSTRRHTTDRASPFNHSTEFSDGDDSEGSAPIALGEIAADRSANAVPSRPIDWDLDTAMDDVAEDDHIDAMLPSRKSASRGQLYRQNRIDQDGNTTTHRARGSTSNRGESTKGSRNVRRKAPAQRQKKFKKRHHLPQMKVTDAPGLVDIPRKDQPRFLKVAARHAKRADNTPYRHIPQKIFQLQTMEETNEILREYKSWHTSRTSRSAATLPSAEIVDGGADAAALPATTHAVVAKAPVVPQDHISSLKKSSDATLQRIAHKSNLLRRAERDPAISSTTASKGASIYLKSVLARNNRSGKGQFWTPLTQLRSAQIEDVSAQQKNQLSPPPRRLPQPAPVNSSDRIEILSLVPASSNHNLNQSIEGAHKDKRKPNQLKRPKKQTPRKWHVPTTRATMDHNSGRDDISSVGALLNDHSIPDGTRSNLIRDAGVIRKAWKDITTRFMNAIPYTGTTTFTGAGPAEYWISNQIDRKLIEDSGCFATPEVSTTEIIAPESGQKWHCGIYDTYVGSRVQTVLKEVHAILLTGQHKDEDACLRSLQSIVTYFNTSLSFRAFVATPAEEYDLRERCVSKMIESTQRILKDALLERARDPLKPHFHIRTLSWLIILAFQIYSLATHVPQKLENQALELLESWVDHALTTVLTPNIALHHLEDLCNPLHSDARTIDPRQNTQSAGAELIVIIQNLCYITQRGKPTLNFYDHFERFIARNKLEDSLAECYRVLAVACFILSLHVVPMEPDLWSEPGDIVQNSSKGWSILSARLMATIPGRRSDISLELSQLYATSVDFFARVSETLMWAPNQTLVATLFKLYALNTFLPFGQAPSTDEIFADLDAFARTSEKRFNDFDSFLFLVTRAINEVSHVGHENSDARAGAPSASKIQALVYSLIPNNTRFLHAENSLPADVFLGLKNHFALYYVLYTTAQEGCRPRLAQFEKQIDLTWCHFVVGKLAIKVWSFIARFEVCNNEYESCNLESIGTWLRLMLFQLFARRQTSQNDADQLISIVLAEMLRLQNMGINSTSRLHKVISPTIKEFDLLLDTARPGYDADVILLPSVKVVSNYIRLERSGADFAHNVAGKIMPVLRDLVKRVLQEDIRLKFEVCSELFETWFEVALSMVISFSKHWSDFLEPHSKLSLDFLSGMQSNITVNEAKQHFFSRLIDTDKAYVFLECRATVFATWVSALLRPIHTARFAHLLTNSILTHEMESVGVPDLAIRLFAKHRAANEACHLTLQEFEDSRFDIVRHLIQNIHGQQDDPESEYVAGGLEEQDAVNLLQLMTKTMKVTWEFLEGAPVKRAQYEQLIWAVVNELETYPHRNFKLDSWFTDGVHIPPIVKSLDRMFICRFGDEGTTDITESLIYNFRMQAFHSDSSRHRRALMTEDLMRVFLCQDPLRARLNKDVNTNEKTWQYSMDFTKQNRFIQVVFPVYIERADTPIGAVIFLPLLDFLIEFTPNIGLRIDNVEPDRLLAFISTTVTMLYHFRRLLEATHLRTLVSISVLRYCRVAITFIWSILENDEAGEQVSEEIREMFAANVLGIHHVTRMNLPHSFIARGVVELEVVVNNDDDDKDEEEEEDKEEIPVDELVAKMNEYDTDIDFVPAEDRWMLYFDAEEPDVGVEGRQLREFAALDWAAGMDEIDVGSSSYADPNMREVYVEGLALVKFIRGLRLVGEGEYEE